MAHLGTSVEYAMHCLLWLAGPLAEPASSRDLADLQGISPSFLAKIFPKLEKAGIVEASEGIRGGYRLARPADGITVLDVVDAVEGHKPLFDCQEIRGRCALYGDNPPIGATTGVCGIHAVMLRAEQSMRQELARTTLGDLARSTSKKMSPGFSDKVQSWLSDRVTARTDARASPAKDKPRERRRHQT